MKLPNHYDTLGVSRYASDVAVRAAYIALIRLYHAVPEDDAASQERLREISAAYWELRHPERRAAYDAALRARYLSRLRSRQSHRLRGPMAASRPPQSRLQTKWLFLLWLLLIAAGIWWVASHRRLYPQRDVSTLSRSCSELGKPPFKPQDDPLGKPEETACP